MTRAVEAITAQFKELALSHKFSKAIEDAFILALTSHEGQTRKFSNEPYIMHPLRVMQKLLPLNPSDELLITALLHDVVEDTATTLKEIETQFGSKVAAMVKGLTKTGKESPIIILERAAQKTPEVLLIKISDRLDNLTDIDKLAEKTKRRYATEQHQLLELIEKFKIEGSLIEELKKSHF